MRAFWAILKDSFREAMASRVLQFLLGGIVLFLCILAIPGLRVEPVPAVQVADLRDERDFISELGRAARPVEPAFAHVIDLLEPATIDACRDWRGDRSDAHLDAARTKLLADLNRLLTVEAVYDREAWKTVRLDVETRGLLLRDWESLSGEQQRRRNRQLLASAFPQLSPAEPSREFITYIVDEVEFTIPGVRAASFVKLAFYQIIKWLLGAVGVFLAILFTASIIPRMFEPGAIDLLMSKPVSRIGVFLAKFVGGCVFILMNSTVLVVGIFFIMWLRYDLWNPKVLLAIPLQVFSFMIFFSISTFAGARWRNVILSVALTLVSWAFFFGVHQVWFWSKMASLNALAPEVVTQLGDDVVVGQKGGGLLHWDQSTATWTRFSKESEHAGPMGNLGLVYRWIGPVPVEKEGSLIVVERQMDPRTQRSISVGVVHRLDSQNDWEDTTLDWGPQDLEEIGVLDSGTVLFITRSGIMELEIEESTGDGLGLVARLAGENPHLRNIGPPDVNWLPPISASLAANGDVLISSAGRLELLRRGEEGNYQRRAEHDLKDSQPLIVGLGRAGAMVVRETGRIDLLDSETLQPRKELSLGGGVPRRVVLSPDGETAAVLTQERELHLFDVAQGAKRSASIRGQGDVTAMTFSRDGRLLVGDRYPRVTRYSSDFRVDETWESMTTYQHVFTYLINPLRIILPQPDELDQVVQRVIFDEEENEQSRELTEDLRQDRGHFDMATTFWSNGLFILFMLSWTCWMIHTRDL
ncbi:MAG: ABC transporter permease [Planctomycetaceae bacterium]